MDQRVNEKKRITRSELRRALQRTIPIMTGYVVLGFGYGMIMQAKGFGIAWAMAMSLFLFTGTMQFVAISLFTGGASILTTGLTTLAVSARHLFYGISMVDRYRRVHRKPFLIFWLTDETYALVSNRLDTDEMPPAERENYFFLVSFLDYCYWNIGTAAGSVAGTLLHFNTDGIDFALTALFISIFVDQWTATKAHAPAICGVVLSVGALLILGPDRFLIPAMILITIALTLMRPKLDPKTTTESPDVSSQQNQRTKPGESGERPQPNSKTLPEASESGEPSQPDTKTATELPESPSVPSQPDPSPLDPPQEGGWHA